MWACSVCAAKIAAERANDLAAVAEWAVDRGHTMGMVTLTVQHHAGQRLAQVSMTQNVYLARRVANPKAARDIELFLSLPGSDQPQNEKDG